MPARPRSRSIAPRPANYRDNLATGAPLLWVALRPTGVEPPYEVFAVTADPAEGEALTEAGDDLVDVVPMPEAVRAIVEAFVAEHHVERPFVQAQARPRRSARRWRAAARCRRSATNERAGRLSGALVAPQARRRRRGRDKHAAPAPAVPVTPAESADKAEADKPRESSAAQDAGSASPSRRSISRSCRRSNRSPPRPTSAPSWRPACRPSSRVRRFAARGPPIPRSAISSGSPTTPGISPRPTRWRASGRSR